MRSKKHEERLGNNIASIKYVLFPFRGSGETLKRVFDIFIINLMKNACVNPFSFQLIDSILFLPN